MAAAAQRGISAIWLVGLAVAACGGSATSPPCQAYGDPALLGRVRVAGLTEASGLAASRRHGGVLYVHNDSGNPAILFAIGEDGALWHQWDVGAPNHDWEDIALGPCAAGSAESCLYLGDVGDNTAARATVQVHVVREPDPIGTTGALPVLRTIWLRYADGPRDCETLLVHPNSGDIYLVEKAARTDGLVGRGVYRIPAGAIGSETAPVEAARVGLVALPAESDGLVTGGDIHPAGDRLVLRTYTRVLEYRLAHDGAPFVEIFQADPILLPSVTPSAGGFEVQGESISYSGDGRAIFTSSEGNDVPLNRRSCLGP